MKIIYNIIICSEKTKFILIKKCLIKEKIEIKRFKKFVRYNLLLMKNMKLNNKIILIRFIISITIIEIFIHDLFIDIIIIVEKNEKNNDLVCYTKNFFFNFFSCKIIF